MEDSSLKDPVKESQSADAPDPGILGIHDHHLYCVESLSGLI